MAESSVVASITADIGQKSDKPILACIQSMINPEAVRRQLLRDHIPHYQFPENAARALSAMADFSDWSHRPQGEVKNFPDVKPDVVKAIIARAKARQPFYISEPEGHDILSAYGLPVPPHRLCKTADEAVAAAKEIGYPVVLKIVSPDIMHKTEFGGVRVNITDDAKMKTEFAGLLETVKSKKPDADVWGVLVQQMAPKGTETILGMKRDPSFGPLLMFGLGGILVEVLKDVVFRVAPINDISVDSLVNGIKAVKILQGYRGEAPRDVPKIKECLQRLSQLVVDYPEFDEIDINPLLVYEQGKGALVLDARFLLK
jgi:acyl-CoA synthetase (NDP forming)